MQEVTISNAQVFHFWKVNVFPDMYLSHVVSERRIGAILVPAGSRPRLSHGLHSPIEL